MSYVYIPSETAAQTGAEPLYTVGFYDPSGAWQPESDHGGPSGLTDAADRCAFLNGTYPSIRAEELARIIAETSPVTTGNSETARAWRNGCAAACERIARHVAETVLRPNLTGRALAAWYAKATAGGSL